MGFTDWFALGMKRNKEVKVKKIKKQSVDMGTMVAGHPAEAALTLGRMMDQANAPTKVLMVVVFQFISPDFVQIKIRHFIDDYRFKTLS